MSFISKALDLSPEYKKIVLYYCLYCFIFVLSHLLLVSIFSFFHFLLEHEMGTIESWISRNSWEIIGASKLFALYILYKMTKLNYYGDKKFIHYFKDMDKKPTKKSFALVIFVLAIFYSLMMQFGAGIKSNQFLDDLFLSSFSGSFLFFGIDIVCLFYLRSFFKFKEDSLIKTLFILLIIFIGSSKIVLPYLDKYLIFLVIHFVSLYYLGLKNNFGDMAIYLLLIVAPLSSLFGMDLVWDNSYAIFTYDEKIPVLGILAIWTVGLGYYRISKLN